MRGRYEQLLEEAQRRAGPGGNPYDFLPDPGPLEPLSPPTAESEALARRAKEREQRLARARREPERILTFAEAEAERRRLAAPKPVQARAPSYRTNQAAPAVTRGQSRSSDDGWADWDNEAKPSPLQQSCDEALAALEKLARDCQRVRQDQASQERRLGQVEQAARVQRW